MKSMIGQIVDGEYRLQEIIGEGAFGVVFKALEESLERSVALKMLTKADVDSRSLHRFLSEGRNLAALNHPNVVQIYRLGNYEGRPYIAMEFVEGQSIRDAARGRPLTVTNALSIMSQVASGLEAIHGRGILHRDLSCNNIVVTSSGDAKILDLGLSNVADNLATVSIESNIAGTILYIAPEVIQGKGATFASDVFSFGVLLYEILAGRNPFRAENASAVMYKIVNLNPPLPAEDIPDLDPAVTEIAMACLQKNPTDRPTDLREISTRLATAAGLTSTGAIFVPEVAPLASSSDSRTNPYLNRVMIRRYSDFVGRTQEVRRIYARLNAKPGGSISIVGDRRIGKSSLLNYVHMKKNRKRFFERPDAVIMLFVDLQEERNMTLETFVAVVMSQADKELGGRIPVPTEARDLEAFKELARKLDDAGTRLVILFDEFELITTNSNFSLEFFSFLRFLANHHDVVYVTSSSRDLQSLCHNKEIADSPFFNIFSAMRLVAFREEEARKLIVEPSNKVGFPLDAYAQDIIERFAGRFPLFLQVACSHFIEYFEEHGTESEPDLDAIERQFYEEVEPHFRYIWEDSFDDPQRTVLGHVASGSPVPESLRHVVQELGSKGYVTRTGSTVTAFSRAFNEFVLSEGGGVQRPSLWTRLFGGSRPRD